MVKSYKANRGEKMKNTLIIDDNATQEKFPNAIIISKTDAFIIYGLKEGEKVTLTNKYTKAVKLIDNNYIFSGIGFDNISLPKEAVDNIINKSYYIGQKLRADKPKK
ncbi:hypothetical protein DSN97_07870 [Deferribacteraceae bacterium V6Fe1]|nr:hypothetical protein DSN97_07870 [Deferribacteraceae bacterium V6Fe1]